MAAPRNRASRLVRPAVIMMLGQFEIALDVFRQEPGDHAHGKLHGDLACAALFQLVAQPVVDLLVTGLKTEGDLFKHLH